MHTMTLEPILQPAFDPAALSAARDFDPAPPAELRLTRRGRLAVFLTSLVIVGVGGVAVAAGSAATDEAGTPTPTRVVTVGVGDTLWDISSDLADSGEVRQMVQRIETLNNLDSAMLSAGQDLRVPVG